MCWAGILARYGTVWAASPAQSLVWGGRPRPPVAYRREKTHRVQLASIPKNSAPSASSAVFIQG
jgi:hypothetical protein